MSKDDKLVARFLTLPKDFTYNELVRILAIFGYEEYTTGKTTGSGVKFRNPDYPEYRINFHKPHPDSTIKKYVLIQIRDILIEIGLIKNEENDKKGKAR